MKTPRAGTKPITPAQTRGGLFRKYIVFFVAVVFLALAANGPIDIWFSYQEQRASLVHSQREQAEAAAARIGQYVKEIENQMGWMTQLPWSASTLEEWRFDAVRLLRQVPAITELARIDAEGREQARMSRVAMDVVGTQSDFSHDPKFVQTMASKRYNGPVYFRRESEPYLTLAIAGARRDNGIVVAEVNLKFIWDLVSEIKVGKRGYAYVVDADSRLIAHPDISLVLRNIELSELAQVRAAQLSSNEVPPEEDQVGTDLQGQKVLTAHARVPSLGWLLFVELPVAEAYAPLYVSIMRSGVLIVAALVLAALAGIFLARRMVVPIRALRDGAARIGSGDLNQRLSIDTGDELQALGDQFNIMAAKLQDSYANLESKVDERTHQLEVANQAKSRFLAAASHDLRQPLHALGLFVAQLRGRIRAAERDRVVGRIEAAVAAMNELFNALLDISKLDAGVLIPNVTTFPAAQLLSRIETTFAESAREKGLSLRAVPACAWVRSDFILLERILLNLVSNALRYTTHGGIVVGCRKRGGQLRIEVWDTGSGIPQDQREKIFGEFYRLGEPDHDRRAGLGLGLAIVDRLCRLLNYPIALTSTVGKGSCFAVTVPIGDARGRSVDVPVPIRVPRDVSRGKLVVVIDNDPLVLDGMGGLFRSWGCGVVTADTDGAAITGIADCGHVPDLIISDYSLTNGKTGIDVIARLRDAFDTPIPAFLMSGDTNPEPLQEARASGFHLLHKPVDPMTLRAMVNRMLKNDAAARVRL
jgi:signal transduction histidine kinase